MTTTLAPAHRGRLWAALRPDNRALWVLVAVTLAGLLYLSTYQRHINGSDHPFTTDVGEIQNSLPRWGIIHHSSYPPYSATGSLFVTVLRLAGVPPAAGASLLSLVWGLITVALLVVFTMELGAAGPWAALGALAAAVSVSVWMDSSLAELHTMTTALTMATLLFALRFGRSGARGDLLWLVFFFSQGIFHQRSVLLVAPAVLLLVWPHLLTPFRMGRRTLLWVVGVALLAPLTYLYLPLRVWTGADWVFGSPGTWDGFWALFFFNNAELVVQLEPSAAEWLARGQTVAHVLHDDMWLPLLAVGLAGLWFNRPPTDDNRRRQETTSGGRSSAVGGRWSSLRIGLALTIVWALNLLLTLLIWEDRVSDALLAAKLPVLLMAGVGLGLLIDWLWRRRPVAGVAAGAVLAFLLVWWVWVNRPFVLSITRDNSRQAIVETVERVRPGPDGAPITVQTPWGTDYWALTYEQAYDGRLPGLSLVDHNARPQDMLARGDRLVVPDQTLHVFPPGYYEERLGPLYLGSAAPGVIEIGNAPLHDEGEPVVGVVDFDLENGARIRSAAAEWVGNGAILLTVYWQANRTIEADYSTAVHLVAHDPPAGPADVLNQADRAHPVDGWYPTTRWRPGEIVRDSYLLTVPEGGSPAAIRIAMYRSDPAAGFVNTPWLSVPIPER